MLKTILSELLEILLVSFLFLLGFFPELGTPIFLHAQYFSRFLQVGLSHSSCLSVLPREEARWHGSNSMISFWAPLILKKSQDFLWPFRYSPPSRIETMTARNRHIRTFGVVFYRLYL